MDIMIYYDRLALNGDWLILSVAFGGGVLYERTSHRCEIYIDKGQWALQLLLPLKLYFTKTFTTQNSPIIISSAATESIAAAKQFTRLPVCGVSKASLSRVKFHPVILRSVDQFFFILHYLS